MKTFIIINGMNVYNKTFKNNSDAYTWAQNCCDHSKEVIVREIISNTKYFLCGYDVCKIYDEQPFEEVIKHCKDVCEFNVTSFSDGENVLKLLYDIDGWGKITEISKEEYNTLSLL